MALRLKILEQLTEKANTDGPGRFIIPILVGLVSYTILDTGMNTDYSGTTITKISGAVFVVIGLVGLVWAIYALYEKFFENKKNYNKGHKRFRP